MSGPYNQRLQADAGPFDVFDILCGWRRPCAAKPRAVVRIGRWRKITCGAVYSVGRVGRLESGGDDANYRRRAAWHTRARHNS